MIHGRHPAARASDGSTAMMPLLPDALSVASSANARSSADWNRPDGFFSTQRLMIRPSGAGTCRVVSGASATSSRRIAVSVSGGVSRSNARVPVTIS